VRPYSERCLLKSSSTASASALARTLIKKKTLKKQTNIRDSKLLIQYFQISYVVLARLKVSIDRPLFSATLNPRCCYVDYFSLSNSDHIHALNGLTIWCNSVSNIKEKLI